MREKFIEVFVALGQEIEAYLNDSTQISIFREQLKQKVGEAFYESGWFTEDNVKLSLKGISSWMKGESLTLWLKNYPEVKSPKDVCIIMAGNIPLVGFHDLFATLLSGNKALIKMSSNDKVLIPVLLSRLVELEPLFEQRFQYIDRLTDYDAVIATGSNNSARYFEYYFKSKPHIIRKNRNSIAVLTGKESDFELSELGKDIFTYYGLGCRNVSKVFIPTGFDINRLFNAFVAFDYVAMNKKYINNYEYNKAIFMLNKADLLENGFFMMKEDPSVYSPVSMLFYQYYKDLDEVNTFLENEDEHIQCVVTGVSGLKKAVPFGKSQFPAVDDYADGVDTMSFLCAL